MRQIFSTAFAATLLVTFTSIGATIFAVDGDDAANIVEYRQMIMQSLDKQMEAIRSIVEGKGEYWHQVGDHAVAISGMSRGMLEMYPHWTGPKKVETRALPAIWEKWQEFQPAAVGFNQEAAQLVLAVGSIDRRAIDGQFDRLEKACLSCHETFMKPEK